MTGEKQEQRVQYYCQCGGVRRKKYILNWVILEDLVRRWSAFLGNGLEKLILNGVDMEDLLRSRSAVWG